MDKISNDSNDISNNSITISVIGKGSVGKTSIIYRFITGSTLENPTPTLEDNYKKYIEVEGQRFQINILDTSGEDEYQTLFDSWIRQSDGIILTFAVDTNKSFKDLNTKYQRILKNQIANEKKYPIILIGNKCDTNKREVTQKQAKNYADKIKASYFEVSALTDENNNINAAFMKIAEKVLSKLLKNKKDKCEIY